MTEDADRTPPYSPLKTPGLRPAAVAIKGEEGKPDTPARIEGEREIARLDQIVCENPGAAQYLARCVQTSRHLRDWAGNLNSGKRKWHARPC